MQIFDVFMVAILEVTHNIIFLSFVYSMIILIFNYNHPYHSFYIGLIFLAQGIYNGCPYSDVQNYYLNKIGKNMLDNELFFGLFENFYPDFARIIVLIIGVIFIHSSYKNWEKINVQVDFSRIFRFA